MLPLTILSGAFVDTTTVPGWLRPVMEWNPVSIASQAIRELIAGEDATASLSRLLTISAVVLIVFAPLAIRAFARER
jgi:ABC-2 type transport system permease protein